VESYDAASHIREALVLLRTLNPRILSYFAPYDLASILCQAIAEGAPPAAAVSRLLRRRRPVPHIRQTIQSQPGQDWQIMIATSCGSI
jgi:hypothetical protein